VFDYSGERYTDPVAAQAESDRVLRQPSTRKLFRQEIDRIRRDESADIRAELREKKARRQQGFAYAPTPEPVRTRAVQQSLALPREKRATPARGPGRAPPPSPAALTFSELDRSLGQSRDYSEQEELALRGQQTGFRFRPPKLGSALKRTRRREPRPPKPKKPRPLYWSELNEAIQAASYLLEKHMHSFPRQMVSEGTYQNDYRPVWEPDQLQAQRDVQAAIDRLRSLKGPRRSKTNEVQDNEARSWLAIRKGAIDFLKTYQRQASPGLAAHWATQGGVELRTGDHYALSRWLEDERGGKL